MKPPLHRVDNVESPGAAGSRWVLLVYKIPNHPGRLRLQIWRRLQKMGVVYLQDAVCVLPWRPDLVENMDYVAGAVDEMGGVCHLFDATSLLPSGDQTLLTAFVALSDERLEQISRRLDAVSAALDAASSLLELETIEEELKKERIAYLRSQRLAYFGSSRTEIVEKQIDGLREALDSIHRSRK